MSQTTEFDWNDLAGEIYDAAAGSDEYLSAFNGWKNYLCEHVGYGEEDLGEAGELVAKNINLTGTVDDEAEHVFLCQCLYAHISVELLTTRLESDGLQLDREQPLHELINVSEPIVPSVFRWFDQDVVTSIPTSEYQDTDLYEELQSIYNQLFPGDSRKALGEYYTPEWLVQHVIKRLNIGEDQRVIDPNCGAGAFINQLLGQRSRSDSKECIGAVHGYEINPVSVVAAKCVYLDHLSSKLPFSNEKSIPIYRVNSLLLPDGTSVSNQPNEQMVFDDGEVKIPEERSVGDISNPFEKELLDKQIEDTKKAERERPYSTVVGNPPWISWENLGKAARNRIKEPLKKYGLVEGKVKIGALKVDSATLSLYLAADHLLEDGGELGAVITESVFKAKSMGGFRRFELPTTPLGVKQVDDFTDIQPFEDATNRTGVIWLERGIKTEFPVEYKKWTNEGSSIPESLVPDSRQAFPLGNDISNPWIAVDAEVAGYLENVTGDQDYYQPRVGINTGGASGIYWVEMEEDRGKAAVVSNEHTAGRKDYPDMGSFEIEKEFLYPLIHGRHISRWDIDVPNRLIIIPHNEETGIKTIPESKLKEKSIYSYFSSPEVKKLLSNRRAVSNRWGGNAGEWYSLFEVGEYTFAPYKVVYRGQAASDIVAAVMSSRYIEGLGEKMVMPNQTAHFVPLWSEAEAHYICGILNSAPVRYLYLCFDYKHPGTFFIKVINIPKFDPNNEIHRSISEIASQLHGDSAEHLQEDLDLAVGELWNIPEKGIHEIREYV